MRSTYRWFLASVAVMTVISAAACSATEEPSEVKRESAEQVSRTQQALSGTGCELDCASGAILTCSQNPCSISGTSLNCNGTVSTCPAGCPSGQQLCGGVCVNTQSSNTNCGACGVVCGGTCSLGTCCPAGQHSCCGGDFCRAGTCGPCP